MGYRGEDVSRTPADWGHRAQGYGNDGYDDYASDGTGYGHQGGDGYGGYPQQPEQGQHGQADPYGSEPAYGAPAGYGQPGGYGYQPEDPYGEQGGFGQAEPGYGPPGGGQGYQPPSDGYGQSGGYPARHASGAYPALPDGSDGYQGRDAGNDWYGGQPAAASGASFADTGAYALNGRIIDEYGTGPNATQHNPARGYPPTPGPQGPPQALGRPQLPAPAQPVISGPQAVPRTGAQEQYNDYDSYPGYGQQEYQDRGGRNPTGGYPAAGRNPTGEYPTTVRNPSGAYPAAGRNPTGEYPTTVGNATGGYPAAGRNPTGGYPATDRNPSGGYPTAPGDYDAYAPDGYEQDFDHGNPAAGYDDYPADDPYQDRYGDGGRGPGQGGRTKPRKGGPRKGGGRPSGQASPGGRRPRTLLLTLGTVFVVAVAAAAAYFLVLKPNSSTQNPEAGGRLPTAGASPSNQACVQQYGTYCHIETRTLDPAPLTLADLYPPVVNNESTGGHITSSFTLETTKLDTKCASAVIGQDLITSLKAGDCTQVLRASYLSGDSKIMGTIGVINLSSTNDAHHAGKVVGQNDFIAPLATSKGIASKLGQGTGVVEAQYKGHYLILTWSEFVNGATPSTTAQDDQLEQFNSDLVAGTANIDLSERMVQGKTASPSASASTKASASPSTSGKAS